MYRIGIDLGGTFIKGGIVKNKTDIVYKTKIETPKSHTPGDTCEAINELVTMLRNNLATGPDECELIGIGSPGSVDAGDGIVMYSNNFGWERPVKLAEAISIPQNLPVKISNDANCAALGECLANNLDKGTYIVITLGTGVGSGIITDGRIYEGAHPGAIEMGHMMIRYGKRKCTCGMRGCFESYCSATGLIKTAFKNLKKGSGLYNAYKENGSLDGKMITDLVRDGDNNAQKVFDRYLTDLGTGLTGICNVFRPDAVLLGGGVCESFDLMDDFLNDFVRNNIFGRENGFVPVIKKATTGNDAGIIGAANLAGDL